MMTSAQLVREIRMHQPAELALLLGAGASKSSGVALASEMISEWRRDLFDANATPDERARLDPQTWLAANRAKYPWFEQDSEYSKLFELQYRTPSRRQKYIERKIEGIRPGWGYLYLANIIVSARYFTTIFTTNFDDLINDALGTFLRHNAVVCSADSLVDQISFLSERAKIIKLHGDYLFADMRNTEDELRALGTRMAAKFADLARQRGLVVIGYSGRDQSVMLMIETLLADPQTFPHSIYWGLRPGEQPSAWVERLAAAHASRFELFVCADFDSFMGDVHTALKRELPDTIVTPLMTLEGELGALVAKAANQPDTGQIREHSARLQAQLGRPVEAELALSRRDYRRAIELVRKNIDVQGEKGSFLTVYASALAMQADDEGRDDLLRDAITKLQRAIALDPEALPAYYGLVSVLYRRRMYEEAIEACEALRDRVATDSGVRRNLIDLYMKAGKYAAAERELTWLADNKPEAADVPATQGMVFMARGYIPQAVEQFGRAVKRDPDNPYLRLQHGQALAAIRRLDEADAELQKAHALAPDNVMIMMALAEFYVAARQRTGDAVTILEKAVRIDAKSAEARGKLGELYLYEQRIPEAERETAAASALQPEDARLLCNLGIIMMHGNREADAERFLVEARERNATLPPPRQWLCLLYATQDRMAEFNAEFQAFARLVPPQFGQVVQMQAQAMRTEALRRRQFGQPFPWSEAMQAMAAGGRPAMPPVPGASGAWQSPNGWQSPFGVGGSELEQAGEAVKAWWQKLTKG